MDLQFFVDLTSVGTFFAFILVCAGVLYLDYTGDSKTAKFKIPYINGQYWVGILFLIAISYTAYSGDIFATLNSKPLLYIFWLTFGLLAISSFKFKFSLLPVFGILTNLYLMTELGVSNWFMFVIWLLIGLTIYFAYGRYHSKLR